MIHPNTTLRLVNETVGLGVYATKLIPQGSMVYVQDSLEILIHPHELELHKPEMLEYIEKYSYRDEYGIRIISWDLAKYVNHCCNSNTLSCAYGFDMAIRDILAGEELTCDYGMLNIEKEMKVACSQPGCRKMLKPYDHLRYFKIWDEKIKAAIPQFNHIAQPLLHHLDDDQYSEIKTFLSGNSAYKSVDQLMMKVEIG